MANTSLKGALRLNVVPEEAVAKTEALLSTGWNEEAENSACGKSCADVALIQKPTAAHIGAGRPRRGTVALSCPSWYHRNVKRFDAPVKAGKFGSPIITDVSPYRTS